MSGDVASRQAILAAADSQADAPVSVLLVAILHELQAIRVALTYEDTTCPHPKDQRVDLSAMGVEEWRCRTCGFHAPPKAPRKEDRS